MSTKVVERPIIVLGAARSGTKMMRAVIGAHPAVVAIPYDINYVWKFGHYRLPHDELTASDLTPGARRYIRSVFLRWQRRGRAQRVVEKTVSNTLRVGFVREVFPDCQFVHLIRDGRDVAASAKRMWQAPMDWRAILKKVRGFPLRAVPTYGLDYLRSYLRRSVTSDQRVKSWGPHFAGIDAVAAERPLLVACGIQWRRSVESTMQALEAIPERDKAEVRYEQLVRDPAQEVARVMDHLELDVHEDVRRHVSNEVTRANIDKWRREIDEAELAPLMDEIGDTLAKLGYET